MLMLNIVSYPSVFLKYPVLTERVSAYQDIKNGLLH